MKELTAEQNPYWHELQPLVERGLICREFTPLHMMRALLALAARDIQQMFKLPPGWDLRDGFVRKYSWPIPDPLLLETIYSFADKGIIDMGAGTGYLAYLLQLMGKEVIAFDNEIRNWLPRYYDVQPGDASRASLHPDHTLLLSWPPYKESLAYDALKAYTGDKLVYIGERDGYTADGKFAELVDAEWVEQACVCNYTYPGIKDYTFCFTRRKNISHEITP